MASLERAVNYVLFIYLFIYFQFQIKIITRCQGLKEKHLQTPLKTKIKATQQA